MNEVHPNEIKFMQVEFERLEGIVKENQAAVKDGLDKIEVELKILNRNYVSRSELQKKCDDIYCHIDKKADGWVQKAVAGFIAVVLFAFLGGLIALVFV